MFNLAVRSDTDGHFFKDLNQRFLGRDGFFRIHTTLSNTLLTPGTPSAGWWWPRARLRPAVGETGGADPFTVAFTSRGMDVAKPAG